MYYIKYYGNYVYIPGVQDYITLNPMLAFEANKAGTLTFSILDNHPMYNNLEKLKLGVVVENDDKTCFRGRIIGTEQNFDNELEVTVEGKMAVLNDSPCRPYEFYGSPEELFTWFIDNHNNQVGEEQQLKKGIVTVTDSNNYITRSWDSIESTWSLINSRLLDTLGGYLVIRYEEDGDYIDWIESFSAYSTQKIEFTENLMSLEKIIDATDIYTACIPYGADVDGKRVTIETVNNGKDYIINEEMATEYGIIYAPLSETTWDDVTIPGNLLKKAEEWLNNNILLKESMTFTALDLANFTKANSFKMYENVEVVSERHGIEETYLVTALKKALDSHEIAEIKIGTSRKTLSSQNLSVKKTHEAANAAVNLALRNNTEIDVIRQTITEQYFSMINACDEIVLEAVKNYTETTNFEEFRHTVEAQIQLLSESMTLQFKEKTDELQNINDEVLRLQQINSTYFTFDIDGMVIGKHDNPNKVVLKNDIISIQVNGVIVQSFDAEGKSLIPELKITKSAEMFGYVIDEIDGIVSCGYAE